MLCFGTFPLFPPVSPPVSSSSSSGSSSLSSSSSSGSSFHALRHAHDLLLLQPYCLLLHNPLLSCRSCCSSGFSSLLLPFTCLPVSLQLLCLLLHNPLLLLLLCKFCYSSGPSSFSFSLCLHSCFSAASLCSSLSSYIINIYIIILNPLLLLFFCR